MRRALCAPAIAVALAAGCSESGGQPVDSQPSMWDAESANQEFRAETERMRLPPDASWPADPFTDTDDVYQVGLGRTMADDFWRCAWMVEWLDQRTASPERAAEALGQLRTLPDTHFYQRWDDAGRDFYAREMRAADAGDPGPIDEDVSANGCRG